MEKVLLINGSINEFGCTYTALKIIKDRLEKNGIEGIIEWIGKDAINDYSGKKEDNAVVKRIGSLLKDVDGLIVGSPTWYSHPTARLLCLMDNLSREYKNDLAYKPASSIMSARRAGQVMGNDILMKHFAINNMPIVTSTYWNLVFGSKPEEVYEDLEGVATMENLADNMAYLIKSLKIANLEKPNLRKERTNFHR